MFEGAITPQQCRTARAAIGWSQTELAEATGVSRPTVQEFERGTRRPHQSHITALRVALESRGVRFWEMEDGMTGLQFPPDKVLPADKED